jgi:hypothetical protein
MRWRRSSAFPSPPFGGGGSTWSRYLDVSYSLRLQNLGFRRIDFFLYTEGGNAAEIGRELLKRS